MDIYIIDIGIKNFIAEKSLKQFNHHNYTNSKKAAIHSLSYFLTDRILKNIYKIDDREITFVNSKPILKNNKKHFSISHSDCYIAICFSDYECGIDIEKIKFRDFKAISDRMNFHTESLEEFYRKWTEYEALYKLGVNNKAESKYYSKIDNYALTAASISPNENFTLKYNNSIEKELIKK